ncbi:MAG: hypothetical protein H6750_08985 [Nitrospiraceae bacterium]|nr:hypothetical protein [Nitrospira sp.]MCB9774443.1 hypothetical protein [Nitrospiraceae bacterium]
MSSSPSPFALHISRLGFRIHSDGYEALQSEDAPSTGGNTLEPQSRDSAVRNHEQWKIVAAEVLTKRGDFFFSTMSGGKLHAIGREVSIDSFPVPGNQQATLQKAKQVRAVPLAPADPSAQNRTVALSANAIKAAAPRNGTERSTKAEDSL